MNIKKQSLSFAITEQDVANNSMSENTIVDIPIDKIREISEQPFIIHEDTINTLVDSIKRNGQLDPCVVTQSKDNSDMYDLLAGRHRKRACELAGLKTVKCIIKSNLSADEKELIIIDTNTERNNDYLPSELAFAFKRKEELLSKTTNSAIKVIANESNLSRKKVYRYIRLTHLIKPLLSRVDGGSIPLIAGVELSYLTDKEQGEVFTYLINHASDCKITTEKARLIKDNPADYEAILKGVFSSVGTPQLKDVDNLSTLQVENTGRTRVNTLEDNLIELVISVTHVDSYICNFYSKKEVTKLLCYSKFDETINEININSDGTYISFSSKNYNKFISLVNIYDLVREYIKNNYDITQIVEAYNYLH